MVEEAGKGRNFRASHRTREIAAVFLFAAGIFGLLSLHSSSAGVIGVWVARYCRWALGLAADLPAALSLAGGYLCLRSPSDRVAMARRVIGVIILVGVFLILIHLQTVGPFGVPYMSWNTRLGMTYPYGAGIVGAFLTGLCLRALGLSGTYIFTLAFLIIGLILLGEITLAAVLATAGRWTRGIIQGLWYALIRCGLGTLREARELARSLRDRLGSKKRGKSSDGATGYRRQKVKGSSDHGATGSDSGSMSAGGNAKSEAVVLSDRVGTDEACREAAATGESVTPVATRRRSSSAGRRRTADQYANETPQPLQIVDQQRPRVGPYVMPQLDLITAPPRKTRRARKHKNDEQVRLLEDTLASFGIEARVVDVCQGPTVTRYEIQPAPGIKVSRIVGLADDLALSLAAADVRIEAPVPGKSVVGVEVPNKEPSTVYLQEVLGSEEFQKHPSRLAMALGKDIAGRPVVADLRQWLHLLVAGATGSGKSVCLNAMIASLLYKASPEEVQLLMIDPKRVELTVYNGIPHLVSPVVTDPKKASTALRWAVKEMERRYELFADAGVRNIDSYNRWMEGNIKQYGEGEKLPYIVVIIDELADLMLVAASDVEDAICRLAQMARAAGMYLIIATQRPSVDVITGLIKANIPSRISFAVSSQVDSRTILDMAGAERLLGKGDMLCYPAGASKVTRVQGALIFDRDVEALVEFWRQQADPESEGENIIEVQEAADTEAESDDELFDDAVRLILNTGQASISMLQRRFRIGYSRAARLIDAMELKGIVGPQQGSKPREVLITKYGDEEE